MKVLLKWIGYVVGGLVAVAVVFLGTTWLMGNQRANRTYAIEVVAPTVPTDAASIATSRNLVWAPWRGSGT